MGSLEEIRQKIQTVFSFYSSFGDRTNISNLKSNKFHKIMHDANINLPTTQLDLIFCKENKNRSNMNFDTFLTVLKEIAIKIYKEDPADALVNLLENNIFPLYENIMSETDVGEDNQLFQQKIDIQCVQILKILSPVLEKIYQVYFPWEIKAQQLNFYEKSQKSLNHFLKEFNIFPSLLTKSVAYQLYNFIIQNKVSNLLDHDIYLGTKLFQEDQGSCFTLCKFLFFLIKSSLLGYSQRNLQESLGNLTQVQCFCLLLERMEMSEGFQNLQKKTHYTNNQQTSLLVPQKKLQQICGFENSVSYLEQSQQSIISQSQQEDFDIQIPHQYIDQLNQIYQNYCGEENELRVQRMKKIFIDLGFTKTHQNQGFDNINEIDVILLKLKIYKNKLNFQQFLKVFEVSLIKLYGSLQNGFRKINFEQQSQVFENKQNDYTETLMDILQDESIIQILTLLHKPLQTYFKYYSDSLMIFDQFMHFCKDFEIFPNYMNKMKLATIFNTLAKIQNNLDKSMSQMSIQSNSDQKKIDQHLFVEVLALIAFELQLYGNNRIQQLIYFMELIQASKGPQILSKHISVMNSQWQVLTDIKKFFPECFENKEIRFSNFDSLINEKL